MLNAPMKALLNIYSNFSMMLQEILKIKRIKNYRNSKKNNLNKITRILTQNKYQKRINGQEKISSKDF